MYIYLCIAYCREALGADINAQNSRDSAPAPRSPVYIYINLFVFILYTKLFLFTIGIALFKVLSYKAWNLYIFRDIHGN